LGTIGGDDATGANGAGNGGPGDGTPAVAAPLARLTSAQYTLTLHDLFAPISVPEVTLPAGVEIEDFDNNTTTQTPSTALIDALHAGAVAVASAAMKDATGLLGCSPNNRADEDACAKDFLSKFAKRAFRRPVSDADLTDLLALYTSSRMDGTTDFATAMTLVLEGILQSPELIYRLEIGTPIAGDARHAQLGPYELASRLSYLLWNSMPDDALFAAAESGKLSTPEGIESEARRLLADPRARPAMLNFHSQWLRFSKMASLKKDAAQFPGFTADTAAAMRASAEAEVMSAFFDDGSLTSLLTQDKAFVNDALAPIYGVTPPGSSELKQVSVDPKQRSGILTNAGLMASFAHDSADSPVLRGVWVLDRFLCAQPPPPPKNVNGTPPKANNGEHKTTRELFATQHEQGTCASCHHTIDGVGFAFEHYDAVGAYRTTDDGLPVDSTGWADSGDLKGTFDGAIELGEKLAASKTVHSCVASTWLRYALGVDHTGIDNQGVSPILEAFESSQLDMRELVIALTKSDAFRTRVIGQ
jgi:hypothetical protein